MKQKEVLIETGFLAKNIGFWVDNVNRFSIIDSEMVHCYLGNITKEEIKVKYFQNNTLVLTPPQSVLQTWLRDIHQIEVKVWAEHYKDGTNWLTQALNWDLSVNLERPGNVQEDTFVFDNFSFIKNGSMVYGDNGEHRTYEEALEKGLQLGLKLI